MSKLKDALESAKPALERELSRIQDLIEEWERHGVVDSTAREQIDHLKHGYENVAVTHRVSDALDFCEDNDDDISRVESQDNRYSTHFRAMALRLNDYISRLHSRVTDLESHMSDVHDSEPFSDKHTAVFISGLLTGGPIPPCSDIQRTLRRALENEGDYARSPEQLLWDMAEGSAGGEDEDDALAFCRVFDFEMTLDGFETGEVVPWPGDAGCRCYIGGAFNDEEYNSGNPSNFVCVALNQLGDLCEEYNEAFFSGLSEDEKVELKERVKQKARPIMDRAVDETHEKYGAYRDKIIASVQKKQDEYDISDDAVSAFSDYVTRSIKSLIENVENEFSEENQFSGGDWGVLRIY